MLSFVDKKVLTRQESTLLSKNVIWLRKKEERKDLQVFSPT